MKNTTTLILSSLMLVLGGCSTAELVQRNFEPSRSGVVKYKEGLFSMMGGQKARDLAEEKMRNFCAPKAFRVLKESDREILQSQSRTENNKNGSTTTSQTTEVSGTVTYASFSCR